MTYFEKIKAIDSHRNESKHAERICSELTYLDSLSELRGGAYDAQIEQAAGHPEILYARSALFSFVIHYKLFNGKASKRFS